MAGLRKPDDNQKLLIEIIKRFDTYINASNAKIAVILSYCMAYIGGVGFKLVDISDKRVHDTEWCFLLAVYLLSAGVTIWAARFAYLALTPQVPSGRAAHEQPSIVFFGDVAKHPGGRDGYVTSVLQLTEEEVVRDIANQAYMLAAITHSKFALIDKATKCIIYFQLPMFALILVLLLTALQSSIK